MSHTDSRVGVDLDHQNHTTANNNAKGAAEPTPRQKKIIEVIRQHPTMSLDEMAWEVGVSTTTLDTELARMRHLIARVGPRRGGHWEVL